MIQNEQELPFILDDFPNYHLKTSSVIPERPNNLSEEVRDWCTEGAAIPTRHRVQIPEAAGEGAAPKVPECTSKAERDWVGAGHVRQPVQQDPG